MDIEGKLKEALERVGWRLKSRPRQRLETDLMFVLMGLRPLVMVDYLPHCSNLLQLLSCIVQDISKAFPEYEVLRLMHIDDVCIYVLQQSNLEKYMHDSLDPTSWLDFVVLDDGPARMAKQDETNLFKDKLRVAEATLLRAFSQEQTLEHPCIDFSCHISELDISVPMLNGWVLGYPVVYVFAKDKVSQAVRCLSSMQLHLYQLRLRTRGRRSLSEWEEVLSFTVPELGDAMNSESLCNKFMLYMSQRARDCNIDPDRLLLDVSLKAMQSVAF